MKKLFLIVVLVFWCALSYLNAQIIEDFEHCIPLNVMLGGSNDYSMMDVFTNPDPADIDTSDYVVKFLRDKDGVVWDGFWSLTSIDLTDNKYVHVKVWKPRISPLHFKVGNGPAGDLEIESMNPQTLTNAWEDIVFDFSSKTGNYALISFMPDFADPVNLTEDITIYFDDIIINSDPTPSTAAGYVVADFEHIDLNLMLNNPLTDLSMMTIVANPDPDGINMSSMVVDFLRDKDGWPWGGFWSTLDMPLDLTTNKYVHVMVWKPRISPVKFKVQDGPTYDLEVFSMNDQTVTNQWQDMVFDFSEKSGQWNTIVFMPDFSDPVNLTDDITIYFDNIRVNDDPNPMTSTNVTFNVDMTNAENFNPLTDDVYVTGNFALWSQPGTDPTLKLMPTIENPMIYSLNFTLDEPMTIVYKYFRVVNNVPTWDYGEWTGDPNRTVIIIGDKILNDVWDDMPVSVTFNVDMTDAYPFDPSQDEVFISGNFDNYWAMPGSVAGYNLTPDPENQNIYSITMLLYTGSCQYKYFRVTDGVPSWDNGEWNGDPNRTVIITGDKTFEDVWADKPVLVNFFVDMTNANPFDPTHDDVYISGSLANDWAEPGTISEYKLTPTSQNQFIYTLSRLFYLGDYDYKYFRVIDGVPSWDNPEWEGEPNRSITVNNTMTVFDIWGNLLTDLKENESESFTFRPNPVVDFILIDNVISTDRIEIYNAKGQIVRSINNISTQSVTITTSDLTRGLYVIRIYKNSEVQTAKFLK